MLLGSLLGLLLLVLARQIEVARRYVLELQVAILGLGLRAVGLSLLGRLTRGVVLIDLGHVARHVLAHSLEGKLVNVLRAQQHVVAAREHARHHGHLAQALAVVAGSIIDGLLTLGHGLGVLAERDHLLLFSAPEEQQITKLVRLAAVRVVNAKLEATAKVLKELLIRLAIVVSHVAEVVRNLLLDAPRDGVKLAVMLQGLAADVERDVFGIHNATNEVVVIRQQVGALLHDHDVGAIKRQALLVILAVQVERRAAGNKQQRVVLESALGMEADGARRVLEVVERALVELVVILLLHIRGALFPDRRHGVDSLELLIVLVLGLVIVACIFRLGLLAALGYHHLDRIAHVVAVARDKVLEGPFAQVAVIVLAGFAVLAGFIVAQRENHIGAVTRALAGLDGITLEAIGLPYVRRILAIRAAHNLNALSHHERRVEADAELADDVHGVALALGVLGLELLAARMGDGTQVLLKLIGRHTNTIIRNGNGTRIAVKTHTNRKIVLVDLHAIVCKALEIELVDCIRRVGDELAQEDFLVGVNRVDHEIEELLALCFELAHALRSLPPCGCLLSARHILSNKSYSTQQT